MITNKDIKSLYAYIKGESVETEEINKLEKKLELIVEQINAKDDFDKKMEEISKKFEKIAK